MTLILFSVTEQISLRRQIKMSASKVQCPICDGSYTKSEINSHVNRCLNALELTEEAEDTVVSSCHDSRSPPHKLPKLEDGSRPAPRTPSHDVKLPHKPPKQFNQSTSTSTVTAATPAVTMDTFKVSEKTQEKLSPARNVLDNSPSIGTKNNLFTSSRSKLPLGTRTLSSPSDNKSSKAADLDNSPLKRTLTSEASTARSPLQAKLDQSPSPKKSFGIFSAPSTMKSGGGGTYKADLNSTNERKVARSKAADNNNVTQNNKPGMLFGKQSTTQSSGGEVGGRAGAKPSGAGHQPLADRMRPQKLEDYVGQEHVIGRGKLLRQLLMSHSVPSLIIWGPPGCGKTTLAKIIAARCKETHDTRFVSLSATTAGVADVKELIKIAKNEVRMMKRKTILFVDEIHRFNKLQQDTFLPHVEDGTIILIGATTENPSFQVNNALLSRCKTITLEKLTSDHIEKILRRAVTAVGAVVMDDTTTDSNSVDGELVVEQAAIRSLALYCDGDARAALNTLHTTVEACRLKVDGKGLGVDTERLGAERLGVVTVDDIKDALLRSHVQYDRNGEEHYNCASALQKSVRGSDDSAAIYWLTRMLEGGEDPLFIARRLVVCASEDIGLADPQALPLAVACQQACQFIGIPECAINLAHCITYLARAPKSNESYQALSRARESIRNHEGPLPGVPLHLRNAPTKLMKNMGYGAGYKYSHSNIKQDYLPSELKGVNFFSD